MSKHTKGPWKITEVGFPKDREFWINVNQNIIARVTRVLTDDDEALANARLIAVAPELLDTLQNIKNWANSCNGEPEADEIALRTIAREAANAIAKAGE